MADRAERQSNIELLRIVAALGVIVLHYNNPSIGGGYKAVADGSINQLVMTVSEAAFICAVNLFVLITGYFMKNSSKRDLLKPIELFAQLAVFETAFYLIKELPKGEPFSFGRFMSYYTPSYWFVFVYIALYLISPYINSVWARLDAKGKKTLLCISLGLFSVYPIAWEAVTNLSASGIWGEDKVSWYGLEQGISTLGLFGSQAGYSIVNFVLMYMIGCYLRDREDDIAKTGEGKLILLYILNIALIVGWTYLDKAISGAPINTTTGWNYENPLVISEAVLLFMIFKNAHIKQSKIINRIAAASFPSYLIHKNLLEYAGIENAVRGSTPLLVLHIAASTLIIYLISFVIYEIYNLIARPVFAKISAKWKDHRTYTV